VDDVAVVIRHGETAVCEAEHAIRMGALAGEQRGATGLAGWCGAEGSAE
jgi:hypothetical protein